MTLRRAGIFASGRRNGGWTPASLSGLAVWLDADDASTFTFSSGSVVSQWNDKSGNGRHFSQGTVAAQPARTGTIGTRTAVTFDGSDDFLAWSGTTIASQPFTIAMVFVPTGDVLNANLVDTSTSTGRVLIEANPGTRWRMFAGTVKDVTTGNPVTGTAYAITTVFDGAGSSFRVNASSIGTGTAGTGSLLSASAQSFWVGRGQNAFTPARIGEVVITTTALSGTNLTDLESYLMTRWGI